MKIAQTGPGSTHHGGSSDRRYEKRQITLSVVWKQLIISIFSVHADPLTYIVHVDALHTVQAIEFLHWSTGCLPEPGCANTQGWRQKNKPSIPMTHVACESTLRSVVRSSMPRKLDGNRVCGRVLCPVLPRV